MNSETDLRHEIVALGRSLFERGYAVGSAGNISARCDAGFLITPTNSCLGRLDPDCIALLDLDWNHVDGDRPSKEIFMHRAMLKARPEANAVVHLHSTYTTAMSCLQAVDGLAPIKPLTPYFVMQTSGRVPLLPYFRPGDPEIEVAVASVAVTATALLLANHGVVVAGMSLASAVNIAEEIEEVSKLNLILSGHSENHLSAEQVESLCN